MAKSARLSVGHSGAEEPTLTVFDGRSEGTLTLGFASTATRLSSPSLTSWTGRFWRELVTPVTRALSSSSRALSRSHPNHNYGNAQDNAETFKDGILATADAGSLPRLWRSSKTWMPSQAVIGNSLARSSDSERPLFSDKMSINLSQGSVLSQLRCRVCHTGISIFSVQSQA